MITKWMVGRYHDSILITFTTTLTHDNTLIIKTITIHRWKLRRQQVIKLMSLYNYYYCN